MTIPQIAMYLRDEEDDGPPVPPGHIRFKNMAEYRAWLAEQAKNKKRK